MTIYDYALPLAHLLGAGIISSRVNWRRHPALISLLISESIWHVVTFWNLPVAFQWSIPVQLIVRIAVLCELLVFSRIQVRGAYLAGGIAACAFAASAAGFIDVRLQMYLFRPYALLAIAGALWGVTITRWIRPVLECRRHLVYRLGATAWITVVALAGAFVRGGLGYRVLPYTRATWLLVDTASCGMLVVVTGAMAWGMVHVVAPKKAAAKVADAWISRRIAA